MQKNKISSFFAVVVVCLLIIGSVYYLFFPLNSNHQSIDIIIPRNASVKQMADTLKNKQVITSKYAFLVWLKITGVERKIQSGKAEFYKGEGAIQAARSLLKTIAIEFTVTIPEGLTIEQIASKIHETISKIDTTSFTKICKDTAFVHKLKIPAPTLEGYLFPNTYRFPDNVKDTDIVIKMVQEFEKAYSELVPNNLIIGKFSKHQIVTIASIVEKEAKLASEQPRISAVFHNRIRLGYPLGADPTVRYAVKKFNGPLTVSDLNSSSPYNTRKFTGIPPGPICSPGKGALQAAIAPMDSKELYFVAKWDGSGAHDFSLTNAEHNKKKMIIREQNELRKKTKSSKLVIKASK